MTKLIELKRGLATVAAQGGFIQFDREEAKVLLEAMLMSAIELKAARAALEAAPAQLPAGEREALIEKYASACYRNSRDMQTMPASVIYQHFREFADELASLSQEGWRDIETDPPPHDVPVLLWIPPMLGYPNGNIEARPFSTGRSGNGWSEYSQHSWATMWQPLPASPIPAKEG